MTDLADNRLVKTFAELRAAGAKALVPFVTAGFPDLSTTQSLLAEFHRLGVRVCELGLPYSDPIADGPVIQASYTEALEAGIHIDDIFAAVRTYRRQEQLRCDNAAGELRPMALAAMVSYSIIFRHGLERFLAKARAAGFDGLIVPDLPLEEAGAMEALAARHGLANVMLIAPTTAPERRCEIARHSRGFLYFVSVAGITGQRDSLPAETIEAVAELRRHTDVPVCVGFGVSNPDTVETVCRVADGAIVGSAIVHRIAEARRRNLPAGQLVQEVGRFVEELLSPVR